MAQHGTHIETVPAPSNQNAVGRIVHIELDERTVPRRSAEVEQERAIAIYDLIEENSFTPTGFAEGSFRLHLSVEENRLTFDIHDSADAPLDRITLSMSSFRRVIREYFMICESYYDAIKRLTPLQIETIDMGRRGLHDEGSQLLIERLQGRVDMDFKTARRLFTLICVLHMRG